MRLSNLCGVCESSSKSVQHPTHDLPTCPKQKLQIHLLQMSVPYDNRRQVFISMIDGFRRKPKVLDEFLMALGILISKYDTSIRENRFIVGGATDDARCVAGGCAAGAVTVRVAGATAQNDGKDSAEISAAREQTAPSERNGLKKRLSRYLYGKPPLLENRRQVASIDYEYVSIHRRKD